MRVLFEKDYQRKFLENVLIELACPSLKELQNRLVGISYASLKNYISERRTLSYDLFLDLCKLIKKDSKDFGVEFILDSWGQVKGGKKIRKNGPA